MDLSKLQRIDPDNMDQSLGNLELICGSLEKYYTMVSFFWVSNMGKFLTKFFTTSSIDTMKIAKVKDENEIANLVNQTCDLIHPRSK